MHAPSDITLDRGWNILLGDLGLDATEVLRRAGLPPDQLDEESFRLPIRDYFALVEAIEAMAGDPTLPIKMAEALSPELFSPALFAALCSSDLATAVGRIAAHKRLMAPMRVDHRETPAGLRIVWRWNDPGLVAPRLHLAMELGFLVRIARLGTRDRVVPLRVTCPVALEPHEAFTAFFGVAPEVGEEHGVLFRTADAHRRFRTARESLWQSFEPELRWRAQQLEDRSSMHERVRTMLLEALPSGEATIDHVAQRLGISRRTLQRKLSSEDATFRDVVREVRERLARHYLVQTSMPYAEVSFLLGFDEPSSFHRAFREWTGATPESVRLASVAAEPLHH